MNSTAKQVAQTLKKIEVFCRDCTYCEMINGKSITDDDIYMCQANPVIKQNFYEKWVEPRKCKDKNKNNNCPDFQETWDIGIN